MHLNDMSEARAMMRLTMLSALYIVMPRSRFYFKASRKETRYDQFAAAHYPSPPLPAQSIKTLRA